MQTTTVTEQPAPVARKTSFVEKIGAVIRKSSASVMQSVGASMVGGDGNDLPSDGGIGIDAQNVVSGYNARQPKAGEPTGPKA